MQSKLEKMPSSWPDELCLGQSLDSIDSNYSERDLNFVAMTKNQFSLLLWLRQDIKDLISTIYPNCKQPFNFTGYKSYGAIKNNCCLISLNHATRGWKALSHNCNISYNDLKTTKRSNENIFLRFIAVALEGFKHYWVHILRLHSRFQLPPVTVLFLPTNKIVTIFIFSIQIFANLSFK